MKKYSETIAIYKNRVLPTYSPSIMLVKGKGASVWDSNGKKYLDFTSGISVCNLGHSHKAVSKAIYKQSRKLVHTSNLFMNENQALLADKIVSHSFNGTLFFCNSGAEANEGMIKFARKWGNQRGKNFIISMNNSFHGRTLATLAATGRSKYRVGFEPDVEGFIQLPFNDIEAIKQAVSKTENKVAAIMLEPIQGEGGIIPAADSFMRELRTFCTSNEILLMFDEVQSGMGRTGKYFGYQNYPVEPDLMSMAKALGNGFPIGAFIVSARIENVLTAGTHASTFGGTPLACSAAMAVFDVFEKDNIPERAANLGEYTQKLLSKLKSEYPIISDIRGKGLMLGIELSQFTKEVCKTAEEMGLLIITAGENTIRFYPPLNIKKSELKKGISLLSKALYKVTKNQETK